MSSSTSSPPLLSQPSAQPSPSTSPLLNYNSSESSQVKYFPGFCSPAIPGSDNDDSSDDDDDYSHKTTQQRSRRKSKTGFFTSIHDQIRDTEDTITNSTPAGTNTTSSSSDDDDDYEDEEELLSPFSVKSPVQSPPIFVRPSSYSNLHPSSHLYSLTNPSSTGLKSSATPSSVLTTSGVLKPKHHHHHHSHHHHHHHNSSKSRCGGTSSPSRSLIQKNSTSSPSSSKGSLQMLQIQLLHQQQYQLQQLWLQRRAERGGDPTGSKSSGELEVLSTEAKKEQERQKQVASLQHQRLLIEAAKRAQLGVMLRDLNQLEM